MKKMLFWLTAICSIDASAQSLSALSNSLFKDVKTTITISEKNDIAKKCGLSLNSENLFEMDGMPVNGAWVYPADMNKDGQEDIFVVISSSAIYGATGQGVILFFKDPSGVYVPVINESGVPGILKSISLGFPDIMMGGPGFELMPVLRWNGKTYVYHRSADAEKTPSSGIDEISAVYTESIK